MFTHPVIKKKRNGRYGNNNWFKYSPRIKRNVDMYSDLEYDHWILIEFDQSVRAFCEQPYHVEEYIDGEWIDTIFDMWCLSTNNEKMFIEVKYSAELDPNNKDYSQRSANQVEKQKKWCNAKEYHYEVHTDDFIYRDRLLLKNYKKILPYIDDRKIKNELDRQKITSFLSLNSRSTIGELESVFPEISKHQLRDSIYNMIHEGLLSANLSSVDVGIQLEVWCGE